MAHSTKSWVLSRGSMRFSRSGHLVKAVHTRKLPRSRSAKPYYTGRVTFYKKGMIKYRYSGHPEQFDMTTPWMKAPAKWRRSHSLKKHSRPVRGRER